VIARPVTPEGDGWLVCPAARDALTRLDRVLRSAVGTRNRPLSEMAMHLIELGGKRLRPALLLVAGRLGRFDEARLLRAAAAVELVHVASLYHDDVIDRAPRRRGAASANATWGNSGAALAGTYLFSCATTLFGGLGDAASRLASDAAAEVCSGELQELENSYNLELEPEEHIEIVARKTATLFELPCRLGALLGGVDDHASDALARYGHELGLAFQLADDALDLAGDAKMMGKATHTDLLEGVYSLPVLIVLRQPGEEGRRLSDILGRVDPSPAEAEDAASIVRASGAVLDALALANHRAGQARAALRSLEPGPARRSLERLVDYVVARSS